MLSADSDDRVDPMHSRKFIAQLQATRGGAGPRTQRGCGSRRTPVTAAPTWSAARVERDADTYAFLLHELAAQRDREAH